MMSNKAIEASEYHGIWEVLRALCEQDIDLSDMVKKVAQSQGKSGSHNEKDIDNYVIISGTSTSIDDLIKIKILENLYSMWDDSYGKLKAYLKNNPYDTNTLTANKYFIAWISKQKELFKNGLLPLEKQKLLAELDINLEVRVIKDEQRWDARYNELKELYKKNNNCYTDGLPKHLTNWSTVCRDRISKNILTPQQLKLLQEINFPANIINAKWDVTFEQYKTLLAADKMTKKWYDWEFRQKVDYKLNKMSSHRLKALKSIGFTFEYNKNFDYINTPFNQHDDYKKFAALIKKHGCIPYTEPAGIRAIGKKLKRLYAKGQLTQATIDILNNIGFILESDIDARIIRNIKRYIHYRQNKLPINTAITAWIRDMRQRKKEGKLDKAIIKRLNEAGFDWGAS